MGYKKDPRYNASGCRDDTAYQALKNIEREQDRGQKRDRESGSGTRLGNGPGVHLSRLLSGVYELRLCQY